MPGLRIIAAIVLALVLQPAAGMAGGPIEARLACEDGSTLHVVFEGDAAEIVLPDGTTARLRIMRTGSGYGYEGPAGRLRGKGREATWTAPGVPPLNCREIKGRAGAR